jgi:toxin HigB-1
VCPNCDLLLPNVKPRKYYRSGYSVRKAYSPQTTKWTYWCYVCGAFDEHCWETFIPNRGLGKPASHRKTMCLRILRLLEVAEKPEDLKIAGLRFHGLQGKSKRWSVCSTANYRITFGWLGEKVLDVGFEDYLQGRTEFMERNNGPTGVGAARSMSWILPIIVACSRRQSTARDAGPSSRVLVHSPIAKSSSGAAPIRLLDETAKCTLIPDILLSCGVSLYRHS